MAPDCSVLQEAYLLFHGFLTWPEPCFSAAKRLLNMIQLELRAPGNAEAPMCSNEMALRVCFLRGMCVQNIMYPQQHYPAPLGGSRVSWKTSKAQGLMVHVG